MMTNNQKDSSLIPIGYSCMGDDGKLCPYYQESGSFMLNKNNCEFSTTCKKDCIKEGCRNKFYSCTFKNKTENFANGEFLLAAKLKICGLNIRKEG